VLYKKQVRTTFDSACIRKKRHADLIQYDQPFLSSAALVYWKQYWDSMQATIITRVYATSAVQCYEWLWQSLHMLTSKYDNDELIVHGESSMLT
jgi:hypothetical protein